MNAETLTARFPDFALNQATHVLWMWLDHMNSGLDLNSTFDGNTLLEAKLYDTL